MDRAADRAMWDGHGYTWWAGLYDVGGTLGEWVERGLMGGAVWSVGGAMGRAVQVGVSKQSTAVGTRHSPCSQDWPCRPAGHRQRPLMGSQGAPCWHTHTARQPGP